MLLVDGNGLPLGVNIHSASPHEVTLIEPLLKRRMLRHRVRRLIYDKAADSDPLRKRLARRGIELIAPHKNNRKSTRTQDGRKLRRYRRRWKVERAIAWLHNYRRIIVRHDRFAFMFHGFLQLACVLTLLRRF